MRLKMSFEGQEIHPGDVIVVRSEKVVSAWQARETFEAVQKAFPDHHVVILPPDYYLETYNKEQFAKFLDNQRKFLEKGEEV